MMCRLEAISVIILLLGSNNNAREIVLNNCSRYVVSHLSPYLQGDREIMDVLCLLLDLKENKAMLRSSCASQIFS
jgi:hypothetical protein